MSKELGSNQNLTSQEWLDRTRELERSGEFLRAYDTAISGLKQHAHDLMLQYRAVLVLARAGATVLASQKYEDFNLASHQSEDIAALGARLSKDEALSVSEGKHCPKALLAAEQYEIIFKRTGGYYPGINAATMYLLAGNEQYAKTIAKQVIQVLDCIDIEHDEKENLNGRDEGRNEYLHNGANNGLGNHKISEEERYYLLASRAEALLILGQIDQFLAVLEKAFMAVKDDWAALATTRKQLRLVCRLTHQDALILNHFLPPTVIHYCGHIISRSGIDGRFPCDQEGSVKKSLQVEFDHLNGVIAYGSLAAGADIMIAEAILAQQGELHVALPFCLDEFIDVSVRPSGEGWVRRFYRCLGLASSVRYATEDSYLGDDQLFTYCSGLAMGLAVLRSRYLDSPIKQVAVWDGVAPSTTVGTAYDIACWKNLNLPQSLITVTGRQAPYIDVEAPVSRLGRVQRAMLFGDVKGFSKLKDQQLLIFVDQVLGRLARVLDSFGEKVCFQNTWGDGIFVVFEDAHDAALCAIAMQQAMNNLHNSEYGLPKHLALRLGGHFGPIYKAKDPVLKVDNYFGAHVSCTARIEPVTPEGCVYVTEAFAAMIALNKDAGFARDAYNGAASCADYFSGDYFSCDYVGNIPAAKGYGDLSMYLLHHAHLH